MKQKVWILIMMLIGINTSLFSFIYQSKVMRKWDSKRQRYHYVIGCSDFHGGDDIVSCAQRSLIEQVLKECNKETTKVIVEDLSSPGSRGIMSCGRFFLGKKGGILSGLGSYCRLHALDIENIEYRFCRVIALGPVMDRIRNNLSTCHASLTSTYQTTVDQLHNEIIGVMEEIRTYKDDPFLHKYYTAVVRECSRRCKELSLPCSKKQSMAEYVQNTIGDADRVTQLKHLLTFDSPLIDAKMIHAIVNAMHKEKVVAVAGGTHIEAVCALLQKIGYTTVYEDISGAVLEPDVRNCVGASTNGSTNSYYKPKPIQLDFLKDYL